MKPLGIMLLGIIVFLMGIASLWITQSSSVVPITKEQWVVFIGLITAGIILFIFGLIILIDEQ